MATSVPAIHGTRVAGLCGYNPWRISYFAYILMWCAYR
jgi:hypothetical protein